MRDFVQAIVQEAKLRLPEGAAPITLYFGGGTPSMLSPTHLQVLTDGLREHIDLSRMTEWSFEANPATFTPAKAEQWVRLGITRISLGAQSFDSYSLRLLGREHSPHDIERSVALLRRVGIKRINLDLMFCLPGQTTETWQHTLQSAIELQPEHISTYSLTLEPNTPFTQRYSPPQEEEEVALYTLTHDVLTRAGFCHYEVSSYAVSPQEFSLHNLSCWRGEDYTGLGPGACGTMAGVRYTNAPDTAAYIRTLQCGQLPPGTVEQISPTMRRTERIALGLRTFEGIPTSWLNLQQLSRAEELVNEGLALFTHPQERLVLTPHGLLLADEIALLFI